MKRKIITTNDGSKTIHLSDWNESYHSKHGALQEALHVFIKSGLQLLNKNKLNVLEVGFGSGLNAVLTLIETSQRDIKVNYTGLEAFPLSIDEFQALRYSGIDLIAPYAAQLDQLFCSEWEKEVTIQSGFQLIKRKELLENYKPKKNCFDLIYFDAFGPRVQPELWTLEILSNMERTLAPGGIFVTYCAKGQVRRDLISLDLNVEKIPGPPGKREMLRAKKIKA